MGVFRVFSLDFIRQHFPRLYESMRIDPLRGYFSLQNVEIPPSQPFTIASFPFQVESGKVAALSLHFPWMHITSVPIRVVAHTVHVVLKEPPESVQPAVFAALVGDLKRSKNRRIIEAEADVTPLTRALQKLLPFLLHRVELDLRDIRLTFRFSTNCVISFTLSSITTHAPTTSGVDLAKTFVLNSFSIQVYSNPTCSISCEKPEAAIEDQAQGQELLSLNVSTAELTLTLTDSQYDFDLSLPRHIPILMHTDLLPSLHKIFARRHFWHVAHLYDRPSFDVRADPNAWFRYAVKAVRGIFRSPQPIRLPLVLCLFNDCIQYHRLHVLQLRGRLSITDEDTLHKLESKLSLEMLLLLRTHARKYVAVDDISSSLAPNWVSRALFGNQINSDSDKIASSIRKSLFAIDDGGAHSKVIRRTLNWSKARVSFRVADLHFSLNGFGQGLHFHINDAHFRSEVGSSFESFNIFASVGDMRVLSGALLVFGKAPPADDIPTIDPNMFEILTVRAQKSVLDRKTAVQMQTCALTVLFNVDMVQTFVDRLNDILPLNFPLFSRDLPGSLDQPHSYSYGVSSSKESPDFSSVVLRIPQCDVSIVAGPLANIFISDCRPSGVGLALNNVEIVSKTGDCGAVLQSFLNVSIKSGYFESVEHSATKASLQPSPLSMRLTDKFGVIGVFDVTLLAKGPNVSLSVKESRAKFNLTRLALFLDVVTEIRAIRLSDTMLSIVNGNGRNAAPVYAISADNDTASILRERHLRITSIVVEFTGNSPCNHRNNRISVTANDLHIYESKEGFGTSISTISVDETFGGKIHVRPERENDHSLVVILSSLPATRCPKIKAIVDCIAVDLPLRAVTGVFKLFLSLRDVVVPRLREGLNEGDIHQRSRRVHLQTVIEMKKLSIELPFPCGVRATFNGTHVAYQDFLLSGTCKNVEVKDLSARCVFSGAHLSRFEELRSTLERQSLSFNVGHGFLNVHLSCVHVSLLVSTIHRIHSALTNLLTEISSHNTCNINTGTLSPPGGYTSPVSSSTKITVQGSNTSLCLVVASVADEYVCFDVQNILSVLSPGSHVFSIRKLSVLTGSVGNMESSTMGARKNIFVSNSRPWNVLLRHVDIDLSHHASINSDSTGSSRSYEQKVFTTILSRVMVYLASGQARILVNVLTQLLMPVSSDAASSNATNRATTSTSSENSSTLQSFSSDKPRFSEFSLECESQPISIELLSDIISGSSSSTIASVELDPIRFSLNVALESSQEDATRVVVWQADCPSLRIEDRDFRVAPSRRVVVETEDSWLGLLSSLNATARKESGNMGLSVEGTCRWEFGRTISSHELRLKRARIVLSSSLHSRLIDFFQRCIPRGYSDCSRGSEILEPTSRSQCCSDQVSAKVSILLSDSVVLLLSSDPTMVDSGLESHSRIFKASLLFSETGSLLKESTLRWRNLQLSLLWMPLARISQTGRGATGLIQNSSTSASLRNGQENIVRSSLNPDYESILLIKNGTVQFPSFCRDHYRVLISDAILESSVSVIMHTIALLKSLDIGASPENFDDREFPNLKVIVIRLLAKVKVPMRKDDPILSTPHHNFVNLGVDTTADIEALQGATNFSGSIQVAADVTDLKGQRIHFMSPTPLHFLMDTSASLSLKCWTKKYARVTLSPMIVKMLASLSFSSLREEGDRRRNTGSVSTTALSVGGSECGTNQQNVHVSLKGIFVYFLVDEPQMQLMRLLLRDVTFDANIPMKNGNRGTLNISVLDVALEDSISWRMPWKPDDTRVERWSKLVTGRSPQKDCEFDNYTKPSSRLQRPRNVVRKWIRRLRGTGSSETSWDLEGNHENRGNILNVFPLVSCTLRWVSPVEHVTARMKVEGLDFHVDLAVLSSIANWVQNVMNEIADVKTAFRKSGSKRGSLDALNVRVDHIVLEPVCIRVAIRAPPRRIRETMLERLVNATVSAETVDGVELRFPRLVFNGDFFGMESVFERIEALYVRTVTSKLLTRQLVWQFPKFLKSARVIITCFTRRREYGLLNQVETVAFSKDRMRRGRRDVGLLTVLSRETPRLKGIVGIQWQVSPLVHWTTPNLDLQSQDNISTLDITQSLA